jgi:hypothetical protein
MISLNRTVYVDFVSIGADAGEDARMTAGLETGATDWSGRSEWHTGRGARDDSGGNWP